MDAQIKRIIRNTKRESFIEGYERADNLKEKWNLIHKFGVTKKSKKTEAYNVTRDDKFTLEKLNEHFVKLQPLPKINLNLETVKTKFEFKSISPSDVIRIISKISSNATGPDGIPPKCYKLMAKYISEPISNIVNLSFLSGHFPIELKNISVTPIPKVDDPKDFSHFRPISNVNFLLKIISSISCEQFTNYLEGNKLIADCQSGFRKKHSCTTAILKLTEEFQRYIANGKCIILVLLDFSNAYGSVDHDRLLQVLKSVGVTNKSMMWFTSFLHQWKQITKHDGNESKPCTIRRGIIQGENNSQALFSIFINNILKYSMEFL